MEGFFPMPPCILVQSSRAKCDRRAYARRRRLRQCVRCLMPVRRKRASDARPAVRCRSCAKDHSLAQIERNHAKSAARRAALEAEASRVRLVESAIAERRLQLERIAAGVLPVARSGAQVALIPYAARRRPAVEI